MASEKLVIPPPLAIAKEAWEIYKKRFWNVVGVFLRSILYFLGYILAAAFVGFVLFRIFSDRWNIFSYGLVGIFAIAVMIGFVFLASWVQAAYIVVIRDWKKDGGAKEAFAHAQKYVVPLILTSLLAGFLVFGATFFLILPGLTFSLWFSFASYVVICEEKRGFLALHTSREFYRNAFWRVWWRQIAVRIPEMVVAFIIGFMITQKTLPPEVNGLYQCISFLLIPFYFSYSFVLYDKLISKRPAPHVVSSRNKNWYLLFSILGYVLAIVMGILVFSTAKEALPKIASFIDQYDPNSISSQGIKPATAIVYGLISYHASYGEYPTSLSELVDGKFLATIPVQKETGFSYQYSAEKSNQDFKLCTPKTVKPKKCLTSTSRSFDL